MVNPNSPVSLGEAEWGAEIEERANKFPQLDFWIAAGEVGNHSKLATELWLCDLWPRWSFDSIYGAIQQINEGRLCTALYYHFQPCYRMAKFQNSNLSLD